MKKPTDAVEFETMLLARHIHLRGLRRQTVDGLLDRSAYVLLTRIQKDGPLSIGELSDAFGLDVSTLNRQTAAMMRDELIERIPDPEGGIARKFRITSHGKSRLDADRAWNIKALDKVLTEWTPEEVAAFATVLKRFNTDIERLDGRPWPRS